ncbi:MAG TPA: class I SAM-dependent methyltransferase [Anaerolineales bacterium]|nr:class I SAM-dependent methyltransferase [Anaerolineales bacterium]
MEPEMERVLRSKAQARRSYNFLSRWYDLFTSSEKHITKIGIQMLGLQSNESILEIGCGTGHELVEFAKNIHSGRIIALDISEEMIKVARKRFRNKVQKRSVGLCQGDGVFLPLANGQFDAVFLSFTMELFDIPEIIQVLNECRRTLKSGGRIGVVSLVKQKKRAVDIYEWFHRLMPNIIDCRPIYLGPALKETGFKIKESVTKTMWGLPVVVVVAQK